MRPTRRCCDWRVRRLSANSATHGLARLGELTAEPDLRLAQRAADMLLFAGPAGQRLLEVVAAAQGRSARGAVAAALTVARLRTGDLDPPPAQGVDR